MYNACNNRVAAGITFVDGEWNWFEGGNYLYWSPGNYYQEYPLYRFLSGSCISGTGANTGQTNVSWDYANSSAEVQRCCLSH
jgi:hypothetical protein